MGQPRQEQCAELNLRFTFFHDVSQSSIILVDPFISAVNEVMVSKLDNPPLQLLLNALGLAKKYIVECFP